jgi:hypothetical protein
MDQAIRGALVLHLPGILDFEDAHRFLLDRDLHKDATSRFISWMVVFRLIPSSRVHWVTHLITLSVQYQNLIRKLYRNGSVDCLDLVDSSSAFVVRADTMRTLSWFTRLAEQLGITSDELEEAEARAQRMLATIMLEMPSCLYTQGHDRFIWVSYMVSRLFSRSAGVSHDFAEAMAYHLSKMFISRCEIAKHLDDSPETSPHFVLLDELVRREEPRVASLLDRVHHSSVHYALKWQLTFFSDEHTACELLFLWDQIVARETRMEEFVRCLCIGHIRQVPLPEDADEMALTIQRFKDWDVNKIVDDAVALMGRRENLGWLDSLADQILDCVDCLFRARRLE